MSGVWSTAPGPVYWNVCTIQKQKNCPFKNCVNWNPIIERLEEGRRGGMRKKMIGWGGGIGEEEERLKLYSYSTQILHQNIKIDHVLKSNHTATSVFIYNFKLFKPYSIKSLGYFKKCFEVPTENIFHIRKTIGLTWYKSLKYCLWKILFKNESVSYREKHFNPHNQPSQHVECVINCKYSITEKNIETIGGKRMRRHLME